MWEACNSPPPDKHSLRLEFSEVNRVFILLPSLTFLLSNIRCLRLWPYYAFLTSGLRFISDSKESFG